MVSVTSAELIQRARDLAPVVRGRALQAEGLRRLPEETVEDFERAEFFRIMAPPRFGGFGMPLGVLTECVGEIGRGCGSSAWCLCILGVHNWLAGLFEERAQEELFAGADHVLFAATFSGRGDAVPVDGGYEVSGRWGFASGVDFGAWVAVAARVATPERGAPPDIRLVLLPKGDAEVIDTWFTAGLRGTGSKDVRLVKAFVPAHRALSFLDVATGNAPGARLHGETSIYRLPLYSALTMVASAAAVGIGLGAIDDHAEATRGRVAYGGGTPPGERPSMHVRIGHAAAEVDVAQMLLRRCVDEATRVAEAGEAFDPAPRVRWRRDCAYAVSLCVDAVDRLVSAAGAKAQYEDSALQRAQRDLHTLCTHVVFDRDGAFELYGRLALGLGPNSPFF